MDVEEKAAAPARLSEREQHDVASDADNRLPIVVTFRAPAAAAAPSGAAAGAAIAPQSVPHLLPCTVHHAGAAKAASYFYPHLRVEGDDHVAALRGRRLVGREVQLPPGARGFVVLKTGRTCEVTPQVPRRARSALGSTAAAAASAASAAPEEADAGDEALHWRTTLEFDRFLLWNREGEATARDCFPSAVHDWAKISAALAKPIPVPK